MAGAFNAYFLFPFAAACVKNLKQNQCLVLLTL